MGDLTRIAHWFYNYVMKSEKSKPMSVKEKEQRQLVVLIVGSIFFVIGYFTGWCMSFLT